MTELDDNTCEQLSAWMDGALPAEEARFLERRLQHDAALRAKYERLQLAAACLRGHEVQPLPADFADRVAAALDAAPGAPTRSRRPLLGWAIAASVALLALALVPRLASTPDAPPQLVQAPMTPEASGPTPGSADLVADSAPSAPAVPLVAPPTAATPSPLPVTAPVAGQSPTEFPLADTARAQGWPRAGVAGNDAVMAAYLVRHNEMAGADQLGGFVPYLDVVAAGETEAVEPGADAAADAAAKPGESAADDAKRDADGGGTR
jgi:negative regulator of sigma E activity